MFALLSVALPYTHSKVLKYTFIKIYFYLFFAKSVQVAYTGESSSYCFFDISRIQILPSLNSCSKV